MIYCIHHELIVTFFNRNFRDYPHAKPVSLAYHGFLSYLGLVWVWAKRIQVFRYRKGPQAPRALDQIMEFLNAHPDQPFGIATDSGGPYGVVKSSLVDLSIQTGRPLVAVLQPSSRSLTIRGNVFPMPFSRLEFRISSVTTAEEMAALSKAEAREVLQRKMDVLGE